MIAPILLVDEDIRKFICDGFLQIRSDLPDSFHQEINEKLRWACEKEFVTGNNIMARVPELHELVENPIVAGALTSILGQDYLLYPHRFVHTSNPATRPTQPYSADSEAPKMGEGSLAGSAWHQDAHSPLARARHHVPRYLILFYYPHDTPLEMGPTRFQAGSQLYNLPGNPASIVLPQFINAGTIFLLHFDIVHAGFPNYTSVARYMVKMIFARTRHPAAPTWQNEAVSWSEPDQTFTEIRLPNTWSYLWHWLRGDLPEDRETLNDDKAEEGQAARLESIYKSRNINMLVDSLTAKAGLGRHERLLEKGKDGKPTLRDIWTKESLKRPHLAERRWNERAIAMEDEAYSLAGIGQPAVTALTDLLGHKDPWVAINASFSLGEIGPSANLSAPRISALLDHPLQQVVRQSLDALGAISNNINIALPSIKRLVFANNPAWQNPQVARGWTAEDGIRLSAIQALLNAITIPINEIKITEEILIHALNDKNGYVAAIACEGLIRINSETSVRAALRFLERRRWDDSLAVGKRVY